MNKTKIMITAFAVFASFLMLMTTTTARAIQEKTTIEIIENQQQEIINSIEQLIAKIQNDQEIQKYKDQLINDRELSKITSRIENTEEKTEKTSLTNTYITSLQKNPAYLNLIEYLKTAYTQDTSRINAQTNNLADLLAKYYQENQDENTEYEIMGAIPYHTTVPTIPDDTTNTGSLTISQTGDLVIGAQPAGDYNIVGGSDNDGVTGGSVTPADQAQAQWAGFLYNMNGEVYIPGVGWLDPETTGFWSWLWDWIWAFINPILAGNIIKWLVKQAVQIIAKLIFGPILQELLDIIFGNWLDQVLNLLDGILDG